MKLIYLIALLFMIGPCLADDFDNPYAEYYTNTVELSDDFGNPYMRYYNKISALELKYLDAKSREQSTANKLLSAAAIGLTGIGGMNLLSGLAEQSADRAAEADMRAYLATFACDYGMGRNITGGQMNIELPGATALLPIVTEYRALAADLKARKEALGLTPGIEAEAILDSAATGLYDNESIGRRGGAYVSLSRALLDENSDDAVAWGEQKSATQSKVKTGAIVGGVGAVGGAIGNVVESAAYGKNK